MDIRKPHYKDECRGFFHRGRKLWSGMAWALAGMAVLLTLYACARMGSPDGGWYDETPPRVIGATPEDKATGVKGRKIHIRFNEFIKVDNATENVVVSPPQLEAPEIKAGGKNITVELKDSLKPNTTYTIDFSDAISDNNEGNPLGGYTYTFATGQKIDTLEVSGYVLAAENLEPGKGILVGCACRKPTVEGISPSKGWPRENTACMRYKMSMATTDSRRRANRWPSLETRSCPLPDPMCGKTPFGATRFASTLSPVWVILASYPTT